MATIENQVATQKMIHNLPHIGDHEYQDDLVHFLGEGSQQGTYCDEYATETEGGDYRPLDEDTELTSEEGIQAENPQNISQTTSTQTDPPLLKETSST